MAAAQRAQAAGIPDQRAGVFAVGEAAAGQELAVAARLDDHRLAALFADLVGGDVGHLDPLALHILFGLLQAFGKALVELVHRVHPVGGAVFHGVQPLFHVGGEGHVHNVGELLQHDLVDRLAQRGGAQLFAVPLHIAAVHDGGDNGRVGGGPADAVLLQCVDQRRLGVQRRRLGEFLVGVQLLQRQLLALFQRGQGGLFLFLVVGGFLVQGGVAVKSHLVAAGAEQVVPCRDAHRDGVLLAVGHLAGHKPAPDQAVEPGGIAGKALLHLVGGQAGRGGADGLVGVLGGGGRAGLVLALDGADIPFAPVAADVLLGGGHRLVRDAQRVGTHIGDQADGAVAGDLDALVQRLGGPHGAGGRKAEPAAGLLLQGGGDKGRRRHAAAAALVHLGDDVVFAVQRGQDAVGLLPVGDGQLFAVGAGGQPGGKGGLALAELGVDVPVFVRLEGVDLQLPVADQPHRHALHPAGGQAAADLPPQKGRQLVAHQAVQLPPGLLGVEQVHIDGAGVGHALLHAFFGDLVKGDAVGGGGVQPQHIGQVPADGLALAVRVGGQQHAVRLFGLVLQLAHQLGLALDGDIVRLVAMLHIDAQLAGGQVADMAHACRDFVSLAQVLADGLGLGGGFHDH